MVPDTTRYNYSYNGGLIESLSNCAIFNNLERPRTHISKSGHFLMLNISEMSKDTAVVTMEGE